MLVRIQAESFFLFWKLIKANLAFSILFTVVPGLLVGSALPSLSLSIYTLLGTWLVACASFVYNQIVERDRDALMERTRRRPLANKKLSLGFAHILASGLLGLGVYILSVGARPLAAGIALGSFFYYVFFYTIFLKPRTSLNTVLGGVSGSVGPLIGEAAVSGRISEYGLAMSLLLFLWQPPHFWCLAIRYYHDYRRAQIPVLPVARGIDYTLRQMLFYQILLCAIILLLSIPPLSLFGPVFLVPSLGFGLVVLYCMLRLQQNRKLVSQDSVVLSSAPMKVFFLTIAHMLVWHLALTLDLYLRLWVGSIYSG